MIGGHRNSSELEARFGYFIVSLPMSLKISFLSLRVQGIYRLIQMDAHEVIKKIRRR